jgi:hypothetical protein
MIPRLAGTPTTNITLKTFATNTLYRADFNYNFRKIDSLAIAFNLNDFTITGDTIGINSNRVAKLDGNNEWEKTAKFDSKVNFGAHGTFFMPILDTIAPYSIYSDGTHIYFRNSSGAKVTLANVDTVSYGAIYLPYHVSGVDMNVTNSYKTIKGLAIDNLYNVTATDSTLTVHTSGAYAVSITAAFRDTTVLSSSVYMQLFVNNTGAVNASIFCEKSTNSELGMTTITGIQKLSANDVLKLKFFSAGSSGNNRLIFYNVNFSVHKL